MAADHAYDNPKSEVTITEPPDEDSSDSSSDQSSDQEEAPRPAKRARKEHHVHTPSHPKLLTFDPMDIMHPNSTAWLPPQEVADYPTMVTYLKKYAKDPKKGLDKAWRSCQDKLLDMTGPLTKILELGFRAKESNMAIDPEELIGWAQRAICQLGNANCAISSERRRSILFKLDPKLSELASSESGPLAQGLLFGQRFLKELTKFVATFSGLDKAQGSLKRAFRPVFGRAGRFRGRSFGRGYNQSAQRGQYQQTGGYQDPNYNNTSFYPSRRARNRF